VKYLIYIICYRFQVRDSFLRRSNDLKNTFSCPAADEASKLSFDNIISGLGSPRGLVKYLMRSFIQHCTALHSVLVSPSTNLDEINRIKTELNSLESFLLNQPAFSELSCLGLWNRANGLVQQRLKMLSSSTTVDNSESRSIFHRFQSVKRTYRSVSPRTKKEGSRECQFDEGFYRIKKLMDDLTATSRLPNNLFSLNGMGLGNEHLGLLAGSCKFNLKSVERLDLNGNHFSDYECLCKLIEQSRSLINVSIKSNNICLEGVMKLIHTITVRSTFEILDVRKNCFDLKQLRSYLLLELERTKPENAGQFKVAMSKTLVDHKQTALDLLFTLRIA
jgi:hypothetical protein